MVGPTLLDPTTVPIAFDESTGTFTVDTSDATMAGQHELRISASLLSYIAIQTTSETV